MRRKVETKDTQKAKVDQSRGSKEHSAKYPPIMNRKHTGFGGNKGTSSNSINRTPPLQRNSGSSKMKKETFMVILDSLDSVTSNRAIKTYDEENVKAKATSLYWRLKKTFDLADKEKLKAYPSLHEFIEAFVHHAFLWVTKSPTKEKLIDIAMTDFEKNIELVEMSNAIICHERMYPGSVDCMTEQFTKSLSIPPSIVSDVKGRFNMMIAHRLLIECISNYEDLGQKQVEAIMKKWCSVQIAAYNEQEKRDGMDFSLNLSYGYMTAKNSQKRFRTAMYLFNRGIR